MTESLDHGVSSHLTPYRAYTSSPGHPLSTSDICILTFAAAICRAWVLHVLHAAVCLRSVTDYSRAPAWPAGQWSVCSIWSPVANNVRALSSLHQLITKDLAPWLSLHLYILSILTHDEKVHYKSWALNYLPGGLFVVRITSIGALAVSLVRPLTLRLWCVQTRIRRGEFSGVMTTTPVLMRSQFHIPFQPRLQPALKYESRSDCLHISEHRTMSADLGSKWDAK